jgi:hypothetical protein
LTAWIRRWRSENRGVSVDFRLIQIGIWQRAADALHARRGGEPSRCVACSLSRCSSLPERIHMSYLHWLRLYTLHLVAKKQYEPKLIDRVLTLHRPDSQFKPCRPLSSKKNDKKDVIHEEHTHHLCMHGHQFCI